MTSIPRVPRCRATTRTTVLGGALALVLAAPIGSTSPQVVLLSADFDAGLDGFVFEGDAFGTSQPTYTSGAWLASDGFNGTGGLQVTLGGVDAAPVSGMSAGWSITVHLPEDAPGVTLSFRYELDQTATYEYDEYTRMVASVDGVQVGRGSKPYVDHIGGDGSSSLGNSSSFLPTNDWQQHQVFLGTLTAGSHVIVLGAFNNKKDALDESTTATIDDVLVTSGNAAPVVSDQQALVNRLSSAQFASHLQGLTSFGDRCRMSTCPGSPANSFFNAQAWLASQLTAMGYTVNYHTSTLNGGVSNLYVTKVGTVNPGQMYIVSAHLDGRGGGAAYDDDGSGSALVLAAAQVFASADVQTDTSVRFIWWDREEAGLLGPSAYVQERRLLQGTPGEPTWLGLVQHDMILYDHGAGTPGAVQSPYADLDVEWRAGTAAATQSRALALTWRFLSGTYSTDYPATAYNYSTNTDDTPFHPYVASISVRENRRNLTSGSNAEWINPNYHTAADVASSYSALDRSLGFNALQGTVGTVAELVNARLSTNIPPTANAQAVETAEDVGLAITLTAADPDGDPLTYGVVTAPVHGTLSGTPPHVTYSPANNDHGPDAFTFKVNDGTVDSVAAAVSVVVTPVNDPPVANAQAVSTIADSALAIVLTGSDVDGDTLTFGVVTPPGQGTLSGTPPNVTYTPAAGVVGVDSFAFRVNDATVDSAPAIVSISIASGVAVTFTSVAAQDGYVLESGETTAAGGTVTAGATSSSALRVGDDSKDRQYVTVLSFDTAAIPDGATIVSATLRLLRGSLTGTNPSTTHGAAWVDARTGGFSGSTSLQAGDFQAAPTVVRTTSLSNAASNATWSQGSLDAPGLLAINKTGTTQFRISFNLDDNDDRGSDYVGFHSGESAAANRPQLVVTYR